jgi:hypothetical protein
MTANVQRKTVTKTPQADDGPMRRWNTWGWNQ